MYVLYRTSSLFLLVRAPKIDAKIEYGPFTITIQDPAFQADLVKIRCQSIKKKQENEYLIHSYNTC